VKPHPDARRSRGPNRAMAAMAAMAAMMTEQA
jgi:hypothetical protein